MNLKFNNKELNQLLKFQEGGAMPEGAPAEAPAEEAPQGGGDPMQELVAAFTQGLQNQDCNLLAQAAQAFLQLVQGGAPAEQAPADQAPVYKMGGKLSKWIKK